MLSAAVGTARLADCRAIATGFPAGFAQGTCTLVAAGLATGWGGGILGALRASQAARIQQDQAQALGPCCLNPGPPDQGSNRSGSALQESSTTA